VDLGFDPRGVLNLSMDPNQQGYDQARAKAFFDELERRVRALPGVESASLAHSVPLGYYNQAEYVSAEGQEITDEKRRPAAGYNAVGVDYFRTMRIPILKGRAFTSEDTEKSRRVAIVNEFMAQKLWPDQDPIGKRFRAGTPPGPPMEVVGVSKNGKYTWIFADLESYYFVPLTQEFKSLRALQVRTSVPPMSLAATLQREIRALAPELPIYDVMTMEQGLEGGNGFFLIRMGALVAAALGLLGLLLAVVGVYGVVSYTASQRTHEIGIRMALGAQRGDILRLLLGQGLLLVAVGLALGVGVSLALSRFMANLLFGLSAQDPVTFLGVSSLLALVALMACLIPAARATRVDPMVALHYE
jgi:putative ABC transport system permease protein